MDSGQAYQGHRSAYLKSKQLSVDGFGTLMQQFTAAQYLGKRVRLSGLVKSQEVTEWAGLWLRVDKGKEMVAFDKSLARCQMHPSVRPELPRSTANPSWL